jgi:chromosome segregation and condensation protein ScpB
MTNMLDPNQIKTDLEALIFVSNKPLLLEDIKKVFTNLQTSEIRDMIET